MVVRAGTRGGSEGDFLRKFAGGDFYDYFFTFSYLKH